MEITIKRNVKFLGAERKAGDALTIEVGDKMGQCTPQIVRTLVDNGVIDAEGMSPSKNSGSDAHMKARSDQHQERLAKAEKTIAALTASNDDLAARVAVLEGGKPAKPETRREKTAAAAAKSKE